MARRTGLPPPSLSPFGGGGSQFGKYDILQGGQNDGREFQRVQARWHAGLISDDAYLGAYQKYVNSLPKNSTQRINAADALAQARYSFARNKVVARVEGGDPDGWRDLLAFDRRSLSGLNRGSAEYQQRLGRMRSSQSAIFNQQLSDLSRRVQSGRATQRQLWQFLRSMRHSDLTANNPLLARDISQRIRATEDSMAREARERMYRKWTDNSITATEFISYGRQQLGTLPRHSDERRIWKDRISAARDQQRQASLDYRWQLSSRYHALTQKLAEPPPAGSNRTRILITGEGAQEVPIGQAPSSSDQAAFTEFEQNRQAMFEEQTEIRRRLAAINADFIRPEQLSRYWAKRAKRHAKGTPQWLDAIQRSQAFHDTQVTWDTFNTDNGYFPTVAQQTGRSSGRRVPGESAVNVEQFLRVLNDSRVKLGGGRDGLGDISRFGLDQTTWQAWAGEFMDDPMATPHKAVVEWVMRNKLTQKHDELGSWALVGYWWAGGAGPTTGPVPPVSEWTPDQRRFVDGLWAQLGLGKLPETFAFTQPGEDGPIVQGPEAEIEDAQAAGLFEFVQGAPSTRLQRTQAPVGFDSSDFENLYQGARGAFTSGAQSFTFRDPDGELTNYFFPQDPNLRKEQMDFLDDTNVDLKRVEWERAYRQLLEAGDDASEALIAREADARERHTGAVAQRGQNAIDMLFMQQPTTKEGPVNVNPAADMQRLAEVAESEARVHLEAAQELFALGDETAAWAELQAVQDIIDFVSDPMEQLAGQVEAGVQAVQAEGAEPTEGQRADLERTLDWKAGGVDDIESDGESMLTEIFGDGTANNPGLVEVDATGDPTVDPDGNLVLQPGVVRVLRSSAGANTDDRITYERLPTQGVTVGVDGNPEAVKALDDHVAANVFAHGRNIVAQVPYEVGIVGWIRTPDGRNMPLQGKIIDVQLNGDRQVSFEQPFAPGRWSTADEPGAAAIVYEGPEDMQVTPDERGGFVLSWRDPETGHTFSLDWDQSDQGYRIQEVVPSDIFAGRFEDQISDRGLIAANEDIQQALGGTFGRDFGHVPQTARASADTLGAELGLSDEQRNQRIDIARVSASQRRAAQVGIGEAMTRRQVPLTNLETDDIEGGDLENALRPQGPAPRQPLGPPPPPVPELPPLPGRRGRSSPAAPPVLLPPQQVQDPRRPRAPKQPVLPPVELGGPMFGGPTLPPRRGGGTSIRPLQFGGPVIPTIDELPSRGGR